MWTLVAHWLDLTALKARCSLLRFHLRHRHRLRAYEALPAFEGLHLATAEEPLARGLWALWALWYRVALTGSNGMVMMLMGRVQTLVADDVRWSTGEAPLSLLLGTRLCSHPQR
jgi:hypothetical protein